MIDYEKEFGKPGYEIGSRATAVATTFKLVYGWMGLGLALSGLVAWYTAESGLWLQVLQGPGLIGCAVLELALVLILSTAIQKLSPLAAALMFVVYAAVNGLTLSMVFIVYDLALVQRVFFITSGMFAGLALWGTFTKEDLTSVGSICGMLLWGLLVAIVVNLFLKSSDLDWIISLAGILIFTGLTAYDAQKIKQMAAAEGTMDVATVRKLGILGALSLYLDFINLFLFILRALDKRR